MIHCNGFGAACPRPQIEALFIVIDSLLSNSISQSFCSINFTAIDVPFLHGVHCPQLSSSKNLIKLSPILLISTLSDKTTIAADPIKQPYSCNVSKSRGIFPRLAGKMPPDAPPGR